MNTAQTVEQYIDNLPKEQQDIFARLTKVVNKLAPGTMQSISYGIPTFKLNGKVLIHFGAYARHVSLYPATGGIVEAVGPELVRYHASKGTLKFEKGEGLTDELLEKIIAFRLANLV